MPIREWTDVKLRGTLAEKHCSNCDKHVIMEYRGTYRRVETGDLFDVYKCMAECQAKIKYEMDNPVLKWARPLYSFKRYKLNERI